MTIHLPSKILYNRGETQFVRREDNTNVYRNTIEDNILSLQWIQDLHQMLLDTNGSHSPQVNIVVTDKNGIEMLLNWLVVALVRLTEPLHNVIVLGLDAEVCDLLRPHNIWCIHSDPRTFIRQKMGFLHFSQAFLAPQTRLLVARLINYWGYSFASYDTDALVLKNPQSLYDSHKEVSMIAGAGGHWPNWAIKKWGFSVCLGAVMVRSGPATEELWYLISRSWGDWGSEQDHINRALRYHVRWNKTDTVSTSERFCSQQYGWSGFSKKVSNLSFLLLPPSQFCRGECCEDTKYDLSDLYVAHGGGGNIGNVTGKTSHLVGKGMWYLVPNWRDVAWNSSTTGIGWLQQLSNIS
jgi:hypothetical protein